MTKTFALNGPPGTPQPICRLLTLRSITQRQLAAATRYSQAYVSLSNRSLIRVSEKYMQGAARRIELPEEQLFHVEAAGSWVTRDGGDTP